MNKKGLAVTAIGTICIALAGVCGFIYNSNKGPYTARAIPVETIVEPTPQVQPEPKSAPIKIEDLKVGTGPSPQVGQTIVTHYTGRLTNGTKFDSSVDRSVPFTYRYGVGQVIKGWDMGIATMKVGGKRRVTIPSELAYGTRDVGIIPANSPLVFDIELLRVEPKVSPGPNYDPPHGATFD